MEKANDGTTFNVPYLWLIQMEHCIKLNRPSREEFMDVLVTVNANLTWLEREQAWEEWQADYDKPRCQ